MPHERVELIETADLVGVASFYASVGYGGGALPGDRILVARAEGDIIGAVRLCDEEGTLVLRGMYVAEERRGQGLGSLLLESMTVAIGPAECWCIPYIHLVSFYSKIGFHEPESESIPEFLAARRARYEASGQEVVVMWRPARQSVALW